MRASYGSLEGYLTAKALVAALRLAGPNPTREGLVLTGAAAAAQRRDSAGTNPAWDWPAQVADISGPVIRLKSYTPQPVCPRR